MNAEDLRQRLRKALAGPRGDAIRAGLRKHELPSYRMTIGELAQAFKVW